MDISEARTTARRAQAQSLSPASYRSAVAAGLKLSSGSRLCFFILLWLTSRVLFADDPRSEFAAFYRDAPTYEAVSFRCIRAVQQSDDRTTVYHLKGNLSGPWYDLRSVAIQLTGEQVDFAKERQRDVQFPQAAEVVRNSKYESEIGDGAGGRAAVRRASVFVRGGARSPLPEIFAIMGDYMTGRTFAKMVKDRDVDFKEFFEGPWHGRQAVLVKVRYKDRTIASPALAEWHATYYFDRTSKRCVGQEQWVNSIPVGQLTLTYVDREQSELAVPLLKIAKTGKYLNYVTEFVQIRIIDPMDESEFTLGQYGLPEPVTASANSRSRWMVIGAIACAVLTGIGFYLRSQRGGK